MYTIGQISKMFNIPISTLRYYDKEGLFPNIERVSGVRRFTEREVNEIRIIECLKKSGMEIKNIKQFMEWCAQGSETYPERKEMFEKQKKQVEDEIERMNKVLDMLKYKCWYYDEAIKDGNEARVSAAKPEAMPEDIKKAYINSHK